MIRTFFALLICAIFSSASFGQVAATDKPFIDVTGIAEREVVPDEIYIRITITERYEGRDKVEINAQETEMMNKIRALGIDMADLSLSAADEIYRRVKKYKKDVMAKREYQLKVGNADIAGKVLDTLEDMKITNAAIVRFDYSKREELKKELQVEAIRAAKAKSQYLLEAIGMRAGKPIRVSEAATYSDNYERGNGDSYRRRRGEESVTANDKPWGGGYTVSHEFRKILFRCSIDVRFQID